MHLNDGNDLRSHAFQRFINNGNGVPPRNNPDDDPYSVGYHDLMYVIGDSYLGEPDGGLWAELRRAPAAACGTVVVS